tara:strand:+ start:1857 stop:3656 length:1800 start_codon:yes stop_codon:yes gene_type:complete
MANTTYQQVTNLPDEATQRFRNAIFPSLVELAGRPPTVYGATWNAETQQFDRDPTVPLTAGTNADIEAANAKIRSGQGVGQFGLDRGGANISNAAGMDIYGAGAPAYGQAGAAYGKAAGMDIYGAGAPAYGQAGASYGNAAGMDIYGAGAPAYGQAGQYYDQAAAGKSGLAGQGQFNAATGLFEQAAGTNTAGQYQPYGAAATGLYGESTYPTGLSAASPYLQAAGQSSAQNINQYMNPYNEQVTNRIAQLGARNLSENILPQISSDFIKAGGYGSTRQRDLVGRAARDTQEAILGQQAQALQAGYGQGLTASASDLARYGQLAGTAGGLGTQQQQLLQGAASGISGVGQAGAGLSAADASRQIAAGQGLANIGQSNIQASQADLARVLAAGQGQAGIGAGLGNLMQANAANQIAVGQGRANIGAGLGNLMQANQQGQLAVGQGQAGIGAGLGNLMQANQQGQLAAGQANIGLGQATQSMNLRDSAALQAVGESGQSQQQRVIDANRGQVGAENAAPFYNVGQAANIASNTPAGGSTGSTTTSAPSASLAGQLGGLAATAVGAYGLAKAKGGAIKKGSLKKVSYGKLPKRGLGMFARAS